MVIGLCGSQITNGPARSAVFLDRDGIINQSLLRRGRPYAPVRLDDFKILPGVQTAIEKLKQAGFLVIVVTNQPDVATGKQDRAGVEAMHDKLRAALAIDDIYVCYHTDAHRCSCRKPKPGMLYDAAAKWSVALESSFMVGDRWRDVGAGRAAGCTTIFVDYDYDEPTPKQADAVVDSFTAGVQLIVRNEFAIE